MLSLLHLDLLQPPSFITDFKIDIWVENPFYEGVIKGLHLMFHPHPCLKLHLLENLLRVYYSLLKDDLVPLIPYASDNSYPYSFPNQILVVTNLEHVETEEV